MHALIIVTIAWGALACSSGASPGDRGGSDSGSSVVDSASADGGLADASSVSDSECAVQISNVAAWTTLTAQAAAPPVPRGGEISDGLYLETASTIYTGVGGAAGDRTSTERLTVQVTGSVWHYARATKAHEEFGTATVSHAATSLTQTLVCLPVSETKPAQAYTATARELRLYMATHDGANEVVLTRR